jgi:hypothetical protein
MSADPEAQGLIATILAVMGVSGGGYWKVAHKQTELASRVNRLDEDRKEAERRMDEGRDRLEEVRQTVTRLDTKVDTIIQLVKEK